MAKREKAADPMDMSVDLGTPDISYSSHDLEAVAFMEKVRVGEIPRHEVLAAWDAMGWPRDKVRAN